MSVDAVAKAAGVSTATVSRVFSGSPLVRSETIRLVKAAAERLQYQPVRRRRNASNLPVMRRVGNGKRTGNIAVVALGITNTWLQTPVLASAVAGIQREASRRGLRLMLDELVDPTEPFKLGNEIDGAVVFVPGNVLTVDRLNQLVGGVRHHVPVVWAMGAWLNEQVIDHVTPASFAIGSKAFRYLHGLGCRRMAYVTTRFDLMVMRLRHYGFTSAAFEQGATVQVFAQSGDSESVATEGSPIVTAASTVDMVRRLIDSPERPDGLFFGSDYVTARVVPLLGDMGIRVGQDIQAVSCDNNPSLLSALRTPIASFDIRPEQVGKTAVARLCELIDQPTEEPVLIEIPPKLVRFGTEPR